jgi:tetratricopeptide (TPR) repeat protein
MQADLPIFGTWSREGGILPSTLKIDFKSGMVMGGMMRRIKSVAAVLSAIFVAGFAVGCGSPTDAKFLAAGKRFLERKNPARAIVEFKNAAQIAPQSAEPEYQLGLAYLQTGNFRTGVAHLMKATELDPKHAGAQLKLAQLMATSRNKEVLEEAAKRAKQAFALSPNDPLVLDTMAMTEWSLADPGAAEQHLQQALKDFPGHLKSAVMLANLKLAQKDLPAAEGILKDAVIQAPVALEPHLALAQFYTLVNKPAEAEAQFQAVLKMDGNNAPALLGMATLRIRSGRKEEAEAIYRQISTLPDKQFRAAHALFQLYFGDKDKGIAELAELRKKDPADRYIRNRLIAAYLSQQRLPDAEKMLSEELKKNRKDLDALLQRGQLYLAQGRYGEAEQDLNACLRFQPDLAEARFYLAAVYGARGENLRQRQELNEAVRLDPGMLKARLALAKQFIQGNGAQTALDLLNQAPESQKQLATLITVRNMALLALGNFADAQKGVDEGLRLARTPELLMQDATLKIRLKDMVRGQAELEEVLRQRPGDVKALELLMATYVAEKKVGVGMEKLKSLGSRSTSPDVQIALGNWLRKYGTADEARAAYEKAKAANPTSTAADRLVVELDLANGNIADARKRLASLPAAQRSTPEIRMLTAMTEHVAGNYAAAIDSYQQVVAAAPQDVWALNNLAYLLADSGSHLDQALQYAQKAQEMQPNNPVVQDTIGWAFYRKGLYPTAVMHLEKAAANGRSAVMHYHLAMAYAKAGSLPKARVELAAGLRSDPKAAEANTTRQLLTELSKTQ